MAKPEIAKIGIGIPEWCLYVYVREPSKEELAAMLDTVTKDSDIARIPTVARDAAFSLICRTSDGKRIWEDDKIPLLSKRQRDVIDRVLDNYLPVSKPIIDAVETVLKKEAAHVAN